jgi:hypothetical protein
MVPVVGTARDDDPARQAPHLLRHGAARAAGQVAARLPHRVLTGPRGQQASGCISRLSASASPRTTRRTSTGTDLPLLGLGVILALGEATPRASSARSSGWSRPSADGVVPRRVRGAAARRHRGRAGLPLAPRPDPRDRAGVDRTTRPGHPERGARRGAILNALRNPR